jgi:hypothetical protein
MSNNSLSLDPRIIPLVRSLKEKEMEPSDNLSSNKIIKDISSEKTSENSAKLKENYKNLNGKNKKEEIKRTSKTKNSIRLPGKSNTIIRKKSGTKISIDGSADNKIKLEKTENPRPAAHSINKISIISRPKDKRFTLTNTFQMPQLHNDYNYNKIKTRTKYVQNLLSDMSIKKYKQSCIDLIKNDNLVKKLYEQAGFEKTNYNYETFLQKNFFNQPLFMYKLEILFYDESNFNKKNFKENFFKNEIVKYLNEFTSEEIYKRQMNNLKDVFQEGFNTISNFDLFHD